MQLQQQKTRSTPDAKTAAANNHSSAGIALPAVSTFQFSREGAMAPVSAAAVQMKAAASGTVVQLQVNNTVAQRYPVEVDSGNTFVVTTTGRPSKRTTKPVQEAIIDDIFTYGAMNAHEKKLEALGKTKALSELRSNNWLSTNNCAICHKNSIDDVENTLVNFGNKSATVKASMYASMENWIKILTTRDISAQVMGIAFLKNIRDSAANATATKSSAEICVDAINNLIELIDASSSNYYIGDAGTNSSIQSKPDPHYNNFATTTEAPPTPISTGLYDARVGIESVGGLGHLSPVRATDSTGDWVKNSGAGDVGGHGWSVVDLTKGAI